jgi:hypothetical protein
MEAHNKQLKPPAVQAWTKHLHTKCESHFGLWRLRRLTSCYVHLSDSVEE